MQRCTCRSVNSNKHAEHRCAREPMEFERHFCKKSQSVLTTNSTGRVYKVQEHGTAHTRAR